MKPVRTARAVKSAESSQARTSGTTEAVPSGHPLAHLQRAAGNQAVQRAMSGAPLPRELRASLESYFKRPLDRVRLHTDEASRSFADSLGARAFTVGQNIHLGSDGARATGSDRNELIAHEVVHTLQQGQVGPRAKMKVGDAHDRHERQAERISHAFAHGGVAEAVDHVGAPVIQRAPVTGHYGRFEDFQYQNLTNSAGAAVGVAMYLKFHPNQNVLADSIGLTQAAIGTIQGTTDTAGVRGLHQATSGAGVGRFIDRVPGQPNPIYGTQPTVNPGGSATNLADYPARPINALTPAQQATVTTNMGGISGIQYTGGSRPGYRFAFLGTFAEKAAELYDAPSLGATPMPNSGQVFETAALAMEGPQAGTYYGSVEWGWRTDAAGAFTRLPLRLISDGVPSVNFRTAATIWNASRVDLGYQTTSATNLLDNSLATIAPIPIATTVKPTGRTATVGTTTYIEVTHGTNTGLVISTALRPVAIGAQTVDLPVPLIHTVTNPLGTTILPGIAPTAIRGTIRLATGTRIATTRTMAPVAGLPNMVEGTVASGPQTGTHGFFDTNDLTLEQVGTR